MNNYKKQKPSQQIMEIPNGQLLHWNTIYNQQSNPNHPNSGILFLLKGRLNDFYRDYGVRIQSILEKKLAMQKEWLVFDEDKIVFEESKPETIPEKTLKQKVMFWKKIPVSAPKPQQEKLPIMQEGKKYEDFLKEYNDLMSATSMAKPLQKVG